jgi:hypothetical protein
MATIARTVASGGTHTSSVPFSFIDRSHVKVYLNGNLTPENAYAWINDGLIDYGGNLPAGTEVEIRRVTPAGQLVVFQAGNLDDKDLNLAALQALYAAEEARDNAADILARGWFTAGFGAAGGLITKQANGNVPVFGTDGNLSATVSAENIAQSQGYAEQAEAARDVIAAIANALGLTPPPLQITSNTTITNASHKYRTIRVTSAGVTLGISAVASLDDDFVVKIANPMTGAAVRVTPAAAEFSAFFLYPGQTATIYKLPGNVLMVDRPRRWRKGAAVEMYVNSGTGNDNNDGLDPARPKATLAAGVSEMWHNVDHGGFQSTLWCTGTFAEAISLATFGQITGSCLLNIKGYLGVQFTWQAPADNTACLTFGDNSIVIIESVKFTANGHTGCIAINGHQTGVIDILANCEFGNFPSGRHIDIDTNATVNMPADYIISGGALYHTHQAGPSKILFAAGGSRTWNGTITFYTFHRMVGAGAFCQYAGVMARNVVGGSSLSVTAKYDIIGPNLLMAGGSTLDGAATSATSGGQFLA